MVGISLRSPLSLEMYGGSWHQHQHKGEHHHQVHQYQQHPVLLVVRRFNAHHSSNPPPLPHPLQQLPPVEFPRRRP